jgi:hypothetical protein
VIPELVSRYHQNPRGQLRDNQIFIFIGGEEIYQLKDATARIGASADRVIKTPMQDDQQSIRRHFPRENDLTWAIVLLRVVVQWEAVN